MLLFAIFAICMRRLDLFLHCEKTRMLWKLLFSLFRISRVNRGIVRDSLESWDGFWVGKKQRKAWQARLSCLFLTLWKQWMG